MSERESDVLCAAVVTAFLSSLDTTDAAYIPYPHIKFVGAVGSSPDTSQSIAGLM